MKSKKTVEVLETSRHDGWMVFVDFEPVKIFKSKKRAEKFAEKVNK